MLRLKAEQTDEKLRWIMNYVKNNENAADGSSFDANANVSIKNVATLMSEVNKDINIQMNRKVIQSFIADQFGKDMSDEYERQINSHEIYIHDETTLLPYCVAIDSTPFLHNGLKTLGGDSTAPQHLSSFIGGYVNLIFLIAAQFAGAVADVGFLKDFHYFAKKDYGDDYLKTNKKVIDEALSSLVYTINTPAVSRGYQSVFYNLSVFDEFYFEGLYATAYYPSGQKVTDEWKGINELQKYFLSWFNAERENALLTFPVITAALKKNDDDTLASDEWKKVVAKEFSEGHSFFVYMDKSVSSLSSCCRLKNDISDQLKPTTDNTFSYTLGGTGVSTGSKNVITLNLNRMIQEGTDVKDALAKIYKYQIGYELWLRLLKDNGKLTAYDAGYISLEKQYLTIGINGVVEAAEHLGLDIDANGEYMSWLTELLKTISEENTKMSKYYSDQLGYKIMFNTEFVPAENLGVKNHKWDKADGFMVPKERNLYNSYFYKVEDTELSIVDKFKLHGKDTIQHLDGGSALHLNLNEHLSYEGFLNLLDVASGSGANYWTYNVPTTICNECGTIDKRNISACPKCGSENIDKATRIIGYLRRVSNFSGDRREEEGRRSYSDEHPMKGTALNNKEQFAINRAKYERGDRI